MQFEPLRLISAGQVLIKDVQPELMDGQVTVLLGLNGSGKSTLLATLAQQQPHKIAYLPQRNLVYDALTVRDLLDIGAQRAQQALDIDVVAQLGVTDLLLQNIQELSGGQQQRVWLAFTFLQNMPVVLLDEPMTGLDLAYQQVLLRLMRQLTQRGTTILAVLHDVNQAGHVADAIWYVTEKTLIQGSADELLTVDHLQKVLQVELVVIQDKIFQPKAL
jgi:iron complex transport system ATP-binding protein